MASQWSRSLYRSASLPWRGAVCGRGWVAGRPARPHVDATACGQGGAALHTSAGTAERLAGKTCMVQGASRGLGLEFVRQLLLVPDTRVIATCRTPAAAEQLQRLRHSTATACSPVLLPTWPQVLSLDLADDSSIQEAVTQVGASHTHLHVLINAAGVLHVPGVMAPETSIARVERAALMTALTVNAVGPILVCKAFAPLLAAAALHGGATDALPAVVANLSARVGSIGDNRLGGWHSYRASKAALNQLTRTLALEFGRRKQPVACLLLHPGTCDTDLSRPFQKNVPPEKLFSRERGVAQLLALTAGATIADSGRFLAWDGSDVPW